MTDEFDDARLVRAGGEQRSIDAKIARLRLRIKSLGQMNVGDQATRNVLLGILDLLADEL